MKNLIFLFIFTITISCGDEDCNKKDSNFRPHIVTHHHKSKVYYYQHLTPCSCISIDDDLSRDDRNIIKYLKNK